MNYDEIDKYVNDLFGKDGPSDGDVVYQWSVGDWQTDRIDQIIEDAYDEVIRWHNDRISDGANPESGLHGLPYIPFDEKIDGMIAMLGNGASLQDAARYAPAPSSEMYVYSDGAWRPLSQVKLKNAKHLKRNQASSCIKWVILVITIGLSLLCYMAAYGG